MAHEDDTGETTDERATVHDGPRASRRAAATTANRYVLGEPIGRGGMGEVLAARDENIGRDVAIKRMLSDEPSDAQVDRFLREARIQARLDHPAIPPVHDLARDDEGRPFFVMKRLRGTTLSRILDALAASDPQATANYSRARLLRAFAEVCLAIELAHTRGVVHRDLKPANIMLGDFGEVYVLDWGVAKVKYERDVGSLPEIAVDMGVTSGGAVVGTLGYMAPEQLGGLEIDHRADVYALGCMLFEILAGQPLHEGWRDPVKPEPVDARPSRRTPNRGVPPELDELCVLATANEPAARMATARELGERVQRFLDGDRDLAQRRDLALAHLNRATAALETGDRDTVRVVAMREASRALALDPMQTAAADLVGRLMIEPPSSTPPEVEQAIDAERHADVRRQSQVGLLGYVAYAIIVPMFFLFGTRDLRYLGIFGVALMLCGGLAYAGARGVFSMRLLALIVVANALLISIVARIFSPLLIGPGLAATTSLAVLANPMIRTNRAAAACTILMIFAVLAPWGAEKVGLLSRTILVEDGSFVLRSPAIDLSSATLEIGIVLYAISLIAFVAVVGRAANRAESLVRYRLHLQAWQLRQLVPRAATAAPVLDA